MISLKELIVEQIDYDIYCDLDGVLVDFNGGYKELTGMNTKKATKLPLSDFWEPIDKAGESWWTELNWMSDGKKLWSYIKKYSPTILSAPSRNESSKIGKRKWVKKNIGSVNLILVPSYEKKNYSSKNSILIDDTLKNINEWERSGGIAIHHKSTQSTLKMLKQLGI